jgi:ketosteroid isomerase-like protein
VNTYSPEIICPVSAGHSHRLTSGGKAVATTFGLFKEQSCDGQYFQQCARGETRTSRVMNKEEQAVEKIEYELVDAFLNKDLDALRRILADEFVITDPNGPSFTKEDYLADLESGQVSFKSLAIDEIEVRVIDGTAVVTGKATADGRSKEGSYKGQYSFMDVYLKKSKGWQAILSAVNRGAVSA